MKTAQTEEPAGLSRRQILILAGLLAAALVPRLLIAGRAMWFDERFTLLNTGSVHDAVAYCIKDVHPPLYFILVALWRTVLPSTEFSLRVLSLVFGMASLVGIFLAGRAAAGWRAGLAALVIAGLSPYHWLYSTELRPYAMLLAFSAFSTWAFLRIVRAGERRHFIILAVTSILNLYTHYFAIFLLAIQAAVFLAIVTSNSRAGTWTAAVRRQQLVMGVLVLAVVAAAYAPWAGFFQRMVAKAVVAGEPVGVGRRIGRGVTLDLVRNSFYASLGWGVIPFCIQAALFACALAARRLRQASAFVVALWAVPFLLLKIWKPSHFIDPKYFLFAYPATVALVAGGLESPTAWLARPGVRSSVVWLVLLAAAAASPLLPGQHQPYAFHRTDWRDIVRDLDATLGEGERISFLDDSKSYAMVLTYGGKDFFTRHPVIIGDAAAVLGKPGQVPGVPPQSAGRIWIVQAGNRLDQREAESEGELARERTWNVYPTKVSLYRWVPRTEPSGRVEPGGPGGPGRPLEPAPPGGP